MKPSSPRAKQAGPTSPCRQICQLDANDLCIGCARTRREIGEWLTAGPQRQTEILKNVAERQRRHAHGDIGETEKSDSC